MIRTVSFAVVSLLCASSTSNAFVVQPCSSSSSSILSDHVTVQPLHLHPKQAAELEACAYELMKEQASMSSSDAPGETTDHSRKGPVAWCRRVMNGTPPPMEPEAVPTSKAPYANGAEP